MQTSGGIRLAVQQDPAVPVVDWPVFHSWSPADGPFQGRVFLIDQDGGALAETEWQLPTDVAADEALERLGWVRTEPWHLDDRGRRVAGVCPAAMSCPIVLPAESAVGSGSASPGQFDPH